MLRKMKTDELFHYWLKQTPDLVFIKNLEGKYVAFSSSLVELACLNNESDILNKTDYDFCPKRYAEIFARNDKKVIEAKKELLFEDWLDHPKKGLILLETKKSPLFNENGEVVGIQGISRDITEKYEYEKKLENNNLNSLLLLIQYRFLFG